MLLQDQSSDAFQEVNQIEENNADKNIVLNLKKNLLRKNKLKLA